jgi:apolipoprotein N-acyltransferase
MSDFSPGPASQPLLRAAGQPLAVSVCYEDAFGNELIQALPEARLLLNGSNNAWYGDSLAPHQHLEISRMRSVETQRDAIRATTNGISALIDHRGQLVATSAQFETVVLRGTVQPRSGATPYVRWGDWPIVFAAFALVVLAVAVTRRRARPLAQ